MKSIGSNLNIISIGTLAPQGAGATLSFTELLRGLSSIGHSIRAICPQAQNSDKSIKTSNPHHHRIDARYYDIPYLEPDPFNPEPDSYRKLQCDNIENLLNEMISEQRPDVILIGRESFVWRVPMIARLRSIPCVLMARGVVRAVFDKTFPDRLGHKLLSEFSKTQLIISCAEHIGRCLIDTGLNNVTVIPTAIDITQFCPAPKDMVLLKSLNIRKEDTIILHASHLHQIKRPMDLVDSARMALRKYPQLIYLILGDGPCRIPMEKACQEGNIRANFRFLGWIEYDRMPDFIRIADVVCMPSESEGIARLYLETQACGRVLLASDIPAAREVISDGKTGLLFRKGDINDIATKTLLVAKSHDLRARIGKSARSYVTVYHSLHRMVHQYAVALYQVAQKSYWNRRD
jgi:glycosyltransferase involved in cell wall biosynthesis